MYFSLGKNSGDVKMKFDELLFTHLGEMGRYQKIQFVLVCLPTIITAMHALAWTFAAVPVSHRRVAFAS